MSSLCCVRQKGTHCDVGAPFVKVHLAPVMLCQVSFCGIISACRPFYDVFIFCAKWPTLFILPARVMAGIMCTS